MSAKYKFCESRSSWKKKFRPTKSQKNDPMAVPLGEGEDQSAKWWVKKWWGNFSVNHLPVVKRMKNYSLTTRIFGFHFKNRSHNWYSRQSIKNVLSFTRITDYRPHQISFQSYFTWIWIASILSLQWDRTWEIPTFDQSSEWRQSAVQSSPVKTRKNKDTQNSKKSKIIYTLYGIKIQKYRYPIDPHLHTSGLSLVGYSRLDVVECGRLSNEWIV